MYQVFAFWEGVQSSVRGETQSLDFVGILLVKQVGFVLLRPLFCFPLKFLSILCGYAI